MASYPRIYNFHIIKLVFFSQQILVLISTILNKMYDKVLMSIGVSVTIGFEYENNIRNRSRIR